jgi:ABC-type branched-subunit amino acid transport system permease subunit
MDQHALFLLLGLGTGAVYAIFGLGIVLEYRSSGVINFAYGALAMFVAYAYLDLRHRGDLLLPVVAIPHRISVFDGGLDTFPAFVLALAYAAVLGLLVFFLVFRPLRNAPPLARLVASVGLMIALQAVIVLNLGDDAFGIGGQSAGNIFPNEPVEVLGTMVPRDRFYLAALTIILGVVLWALYRFTTFGLATRAAAENEKGAALCGYSSTQLGAVNWVVATMLAGAAGILITPISGLDPTTFTLLVVPALGAALLGRLTSFSVTLIAGLAIGMLQSEVTKLTIEFDWLPKSGLQEGLPFVVIIVALVFLGKSIPWRNALVDRSLPAVGRPRHIVLTAFGSLVIGVVALYTLSSSLRLGLIQSLIIVLLGMSLVLVTGLAGQISLAQMAIAGFGGFMFGIFANDLAVPFPLSLVIAGLATAPLGVLVGLPALRARGLYLAVLTLAAAVALDAFLFKNTDFTGGALGRKIPAASIFGIDLNIRSSDAQAYPRPEFGVLLLVVVVVVGVALAFLRRGSFGRQMLAMRANERAAIAAGISTPVTKLLAFAGAAFIAGLAGSMIGLSTGNLSGNQFQVFASLLVVALVYIGGIARISGAVIAGIVFAPQGFGPTLLDDWFGIGRYAVIIGGVGLIVMTIVEPDGLSAAIERGVRRVIPRRAPSRPTAPAALEASGAPS